MRTDFIIDIEDAHIYLAAPFFKKDQLEKVEQIESALSETMVSFYSPRSEGVIQTFSKEEKEARANYIYQRNIEEMDRANIMIALIDDFDTGTVFEMGYFHATRLPVISVSGEGHGMNIMLRNSVSAHCPRISDLVNLLGHVKESGVFSSKELSDFDYFEGDVF